MSDTPKTDALEETVWWYRWDEDALALCRKLERNIYEAEREIKDLTIRAQKAESERNALKELSLQLAKELVSKCPDPVHKHQVSQLQEVEDFFKYRPKTMCASDSANCQLPTAYEL